jgi:hypothetical protein
MSLEEEGGIRWLKRDLVRKVGDGYGTFFLRMLGYLVFRS